MLLEEAKPVQEQINPLLPRRDPGDTDADWHRRILYRTIRVVRLWEAAEDKRPVHGSLRHHFAKNLILGEVANHIEGIRIDRTGKLEAFVVEKTTAERDKENNLANWLWPHSCCSTRPAARNIETLRPKLDCPNTFD